MVEIHIGLSVDAARTDMPVLAAIGMPVQVLKKQCRYKAYQHRPLTIEIPRIK